jgi:hypothetical protein
VGAGWRTTATTEFPIETGGLVHAYYVTNRAGQFRIRVSYGGDSNYASAKSGWKAFRVRSVR